jgi:hypothetical protein
VVSAIIVVLSAVVIPRYRVGDQHFRVQRSAHKLAQDLRHVQEMAMGAKEIGKDTSEPFYPKGGFGIYFDASNPEYYTIFADCDSNGILQGGNRCGPSGERFGEEIEKIYFESKVEIGSVLPSSPLYIIFEAPYPTISISGGTVATINLWLTNDHEKIKIIKVNEAGLIYVE